jgi:hypothetical protein
MPKGACGWVAVAAGCLLALGCGSNDREASEASPSASSEATESTGTTSSSAKQRPLYGDYRRRIRDLEPEPPDRSRKEGGWYETWLVGFGEGESWNGILTLIYMGDERTGGRTYEFSSDDQLLHLEQEKAILGTGAFTCQRNGPATYAWSRPENGYTLSLEGIEEPCEIHRNILEGEWSFLD